MPKGNPSPLNKWEKGQSGNPTGRPKRLLDARLEIDKQWAEIADPDDPLKRTKGQRLIAMLFDKAIAQGSIRAANEILDRRLGKPPQALAIADLRPENRDDAIRSIFETLREIEKQEATAKLADKTSETIQ